MSGTGTLLFGLALLRKAAGMGNIPAARGLVFSKKVCYNTTKPCNRVPGGNVNFASPLCGRMEYYMKNRLRLILTAALTLCLLLLACTALVSCADKTCHHRNMEYTVIEPTCSGEGFTRCVCPDCGYTYICDQRAPRGHIYQTSVTKATHETPGYTTYTCDCGFSYVSDAVAPLGHTFTAVTVANTCVDEGYTTYTCDCGFSYVGDRKDPLGHSLVTLSLSATCSAPGYTLVSCERCNYSYTKDYVTVDHDYEKKVTAPTCTEGGYTTYVCRYCDYSYRSDFTTQEHRFVTSTVAPTCTENGYDLHTCSLCKYSYKTDFTSTSHVLSTVATAPTCTEGGYTTYSCSKCGMSYRSDFTSPKGHDYTTTRVVAPGCEQPGYSEYECRTCHSSYRSDYTAPSGHSFSKTVVRPSVGTTGFTVYSCRCGYSYMGDYVWYTEIFSGAAGAGAGVVARGVDVSYHNEVNFTTLKEAGVNYVILRAAYGMTPDTKFETYYTAAKAAGLDVGCYVYSTATTVEAARAEALNLLVLLSGKTMEYPVYYDLEDASQEALGKTTLMNMIDAFCTTLSDNDWYPGLYTNLNWLNNILDTEKTLRLYDVWIARYPSPEQLSSMGLSFYDRTYKMWQYTESGSVSGITGGVDQDVCYFNYPAHLKKYGYNGQ